MNELAAVQVADAVLRLHDSSHDWLLGVAERFGEAFPNTRGIIAQEYETRADGGAVRLFTDIQRGALALPLSQVGLAALSSDQCQLVYGQGAQCVTASEVFDDRLPASLAEEWGAVGVRDVVGLFTCGPQGRGVAVAAALEEPLRVAPFSRLRWAQVAQQMQLASRLHRRLARWPLQSGSYARFTADHKCIDAGGAADESGVRSHLRELVEALSRARKESARGDSGAVFSLWERLARGQWLLLDQFDGEHERHIVAIPCSTSSSLRELSPQQDAIARAAGRGLSNKEIAAELDLSERAVDNQLRRALQKLGLQNRTSLVRLWSALERAGHV